MTQEKGCCPKCFDDRRLNGRIGHRGLVGDCSYCGSANVKVVNPSELTDYFQPILEGYELVAAGTHYIPEIESASGQPLDELVDEDTPGLFSERLSETGRQQLVQ